MAEGPAPGRVRARNLLSSYYGVADEGGAVSTAAADDDDMNIDSHAFAVDKYVGTLLQYKSLEELVQRGNAMVSEIKSLDSDMQMLVYENYHKFIGATDTIRKMKTRVEEMESQMVELEKSMGTISAASDSVDSSLSARRGQLEKLNGAKKNLNKLQFLTELPSRLQRCVREEQHETAVQDFRKARRILRAVGHVGSFEGIEDEATLIMKRLAQALSVRLQQPALAAQTLGATSRLLLQLEGNESGLLREYLSRRRRALHEVLSSSSGPAGLSAATEASADPDEAAPSGAPAADAEADAEADDADELPPAASDVARLGASFMPQLVELHDEWQRLFMEDAEPPVLPPREGAGGGAAPLSMTAKEAMLLEALQELCGGYIEMCRRRLQEESIEPEVLLAGLKQLVGALEDLHALVPQAKLMQRATRAAEQLAKRSMDTQLGALQQKLVALVTELVAVDAADAASALQAQLQAAGNAVAAHVRDALATTAPLLVPLCELLNLRADGMAKHLVGRLYVALLNVAKEATLETTSDASGVLMRAGLCLQMVSTGVPQVPAMLKAQLSPHGLGGAALGFDSISMTREMQASADLMLERFVEKQAQKLSLAVTNRMETTDWLHCSPPREVTHLVEAILMELRAMQALAGNVLPGEPVRSLLPQGPFPAASATVQLVPQRSKQTMGAASSNAIQKDLQRMFARKIVFATGAFGGASGGKASVASMLTHVTKLTLKTLVEEVRLSTFSRAGFQQIQVDCAMLRWVLPACVEDEGSVLALLDEALISCQERCLDAVAVEPGVMEDLCQVKRRALMGGPLA